jgi:hypothetical protein
MHLQCIRCIHDASFLTTTCTCDHKLNTHTVTRTCKSAHSQARCAAHVARSKMPTRLAQLPPASALRIGWLARCLAQLAHLHAAASSSQSQSFCSVLPNSTKAGLPGRRRTSRLSEGKKSTRGRERQPFSSATVCARQVRSRSTPRHAHFSTPPLFPTKDLHMIKRRTGATYVSTRTQTHGQHRHHHTHPPPSSSRLRQHKVVPTALTMQLWPHSLLVFAIVGESHPYPTISCAQKLLTSMSWQTAEHFALPQFGLYRPPVPIKPAVDPFRASCAV